jgi:hypothetical protein
MKAATRFLVASVLALWVSFAASGSVDVAHAQATTCTCPGAGPAQYIGGGQCVVLICPPGNHFGTVHGHDGCLPNSNDPNSDNSHPSTPFHGAHFAAACKSAAPALGGLIAVQQQSSFGAVQAVLQAKRDRLQGGVSPPPSGAGAAMGYGPSNPDGSTGALGYAAVDRTGMPSRNPLAGIPNGVPGSPGAAGPPNGPVWATWVEGTGDWEKRNALNTYDLGRTQAIYSAHVGVDATFASPFFGQDYFVGGVVANYASATIDLVNGVRIKLAGAGGGFYAMYLNGGFSTDLVAKWDTLNLQEDLAAVGLPDDAIGVNVAGVAGNIQYKYRFGWGFIEPTMGFVFSRVMFGDKAAEMGIKDGSTLRLQAGARFGSAFHFNNVIVEPTVGVLAYSNVIAEGTTLATVGNVPIQTPPTDQGLVRVEVNPELNFSFNNGYSAYVRGSVRAGGEMVGGAAKVGVRKEF